VTTIDGQPVLPVNFASGRNESLPVEVLDYSALVERMGPEYFLHAQRPSFEFLILVRAGTGVHTVDFQHHTLHPGRVLFVRPGQVQQWHIDNTLGATVVVATPTATNAPS
jgi:hypothetical protein